MIIVKSCPICGTEIKKGKNRRLTKTCGDKRCFSEYASMIRKRQPKSCPVCGTPVRQATDRRFLKTCSDECAAIIRRRGAQLANSKRWRGGQSAGALRHRRMVKFSVLEHYSNGTMACSCCGETRPEFLTIDHINGGGHAHRKLLGNGSASAGGGSLYYRLRKDGFPSGYRVLCQNCNFSLGVFGYCPHQMPHADIFAVLREDQQPKMNCASGCEGLREQAECELDSPTCPE